MSANVRYHSKWHSKNHHTKSTPGYFDSASDPIASASDPFQGDFYLNGTLSAKNVIVGTSYVNVLSAGGYALSVNTVNSNYTIQPTDRTIFASGAITLTLPPAATVPSQEFIIKRTGTSDVVINTQNSELIEGSYSSIDLDRQYATVTLLSFNGGWWIIFTQ